MASMAKNSKQRKGSSSAQKPEFGRTPSLTDSSLFGLLSVINLDDICLKTFPIDAVLPDGSKRELKVNRFSNVKDVIHDICKEYKLDHPRVRFCSSNTPVSLDANAALLENREIIVDEARKESKEAKQEDPRLTHLKNIINGEEKYLESLMVTVEVYGEVLRKSSLNHLDHGIIFGRLKPIQEATASLLLKLKDVRDGWNSSSCVATAFSDLPDLLWTYDNYFSRLAASKRILRQKCKYDSEFLSMVNEIKTTAKDSLGLLILLPARRVSQYNNYLTDAIECTPDDHDDRRRLKVFIEKIQQILTDRKEDIDEVENEFRLIEIQDKFPHDDLGLDEEKGLSNQRLRTLLSARRRSAPATAIKAAFGKTSKNSLPSIDISLTIHSEPTPDSPQPSSIFVQEGMVQLTTGGLSHDRYMFLFNDFLLVAKSKSSSYYKLKDRVKVSEMWIAGCIECMAENVKSPEKSFVLGWPTENFIASFSSMEERNKWHDALSSNIASQKELEEPKMMPIKIQYKDNESVQSLTKSVSVGQLDDANKVVQMALDLFNIWNKENSNDHQLWVMYKDGAYPLIGHEFPFAIQMNQHREMSILDDSDFIAPVPDPSTSTPAIEITPENKLQFILKKGRKMHNKVGLNRLVKMRKNKKLSKKMSGIKLPPYDMIMAPGKVFGQPLEQLTSEEEVVPKPINGLLVRLFRYGPSTSGVFRKTPNQREVKELKEEIDEGKEVSFEDTSVHVAAGLVKEFLRNLPDALCCSEYYENFLATNDIKDTSERVQEITRLAEKLPAANLELIKRFFSVLYHISQNCEQNNMTSFNLGVCVAQSILKPAESMKAETAEQAKSTAPQFVEFIIDHFPEIFGEDAVTVLGDTSEIIVDVPTVTENGDSEVFDTAEESRPRSQSLHHSDSSIYKSVTAEDKTEQTGNLLTVMDNNANLSKSTPSSPKLQRKSEKTLDPNDISKKVHSAFYHPKYSPRYIRRNSDKSSKIESEKLREAERSRKDPKRSRKKPVILTTTTSSAELIEHVPDDSISLSTSYNSLSVVRPEPAMVKKTFAPKREGMLYASSQNFYTAPAYIAERVNTVHDRRRQPAAPSYQEHMQRTRSQKTLAVQKGLNVQIPSSTLRESNSEGSLAGNEIPDGSKAMETKVGLLLNAESDVDLSPSQTHIISTPGHYSNANYTSNLSPGPSSGSCHVSPTSSERSVPKMSTGSETSISSLSSADDIMDASDSEKLDVTRLKHIRDLLDVSGYANPLRISTEAANLITKAHGEWGHVINDDADMDDYQRMTMAEETYV